MDDIQHAQHLVFAKDGCFSSQHLGYRFHELPGPVVIGWDSLDQEKGYMTRILGCPRKLVKG